MRATGTRPALGYGGQSRKETSLVQAVIVFKASIWEMRKEFGDVGERLPNQ